LQVTNFDGSIVLAKMPPIIDPIHNQPSTKAPAGAGDNTPSQPTPEGMANQVSDIVVTISPEIDGIKHVDLDINHILIAKIPPKQI
jgi:hypothetical protein